MSKGNNTMDFQSIMILAAMCYLIPVLAVEAVHDYKVKHAHR